MVTNALSRTRVLDTLGELIEPDGSMAIMPSGQGSIANNERGGFEIKRASKSALNQLMRSHAAVTTTPIECWSHGAWLGQDRARRPERSSHHQREHP